MSCVNFGSKLKNEKRHSDKHGDISFRLAIFFSVFLHENMFYSTHLFSSCWTRDTMFCPELPNIKIK